MSLNLFFRAIRRLISGRPKPTAPIDAAEVGAAYRPEATCIPLLGQIPQLFAEASKVSATFSRPPKILMRLPSGQLYFDSDVELDTDGWKDGSKQQDPDWQPQTSLRYSDGSSVDASRVPYIVLPLPVSWTAQFGIKLGDYAALLFRGKLAFAVFGDFGPNPGEASIELLRRVGRERILDGKLINAGIGPGAITIVFPGSGPAPAKFPDEATLLSAIETRASQLFTSIGGRIQVEGDASDLEADVSEMQPVQGLASAIVSSAQREFNEYGNYVETESPLRERIGEYWRALGEPYDGASNEPWSAAFVSWNVMQAGGENSFECSGQHSVYVHRAILDHMAQRQGRFWAYRSSEIAVAEGDILAMNRGNNRPIDFAEAAQSNDYESHCDIVTTIESGTIETLGGNVGRAPGTIAGKSFAWRAGNLVNTNNPAQRVYAIMRAPPA